MAKKSQAKEAEDPVETIADDKGTTLDDAPGEWQGDPEEGAKVETKEHKHARAILGR